MRSVPPASAELLHVLMLPDFERAEVVRWNEPFPKRR
jgi:hypothetical protein